MSTFGPFGIGENQGNSFRMNFRTPGQNLRNGTQALRSTSAPNVTIDESKEQLRAASAELTKAFRALKNGTRPVYTTSAATTAPRRAMLVGLGARVGAVQADYSVLRTTLKINTQTSTDRRSSTDLGLDLASPAVSTLYSSVLGLDITAGTAASSLDSSAGLDLDLTSPEAPSLLRSAAALGLDLTSPEIASQLASALALGLDITSAQTASTVTSTAEMNSAATSLSTSDLAFASSTSHAELSGAYEGSATSLTIKTKAPATVGSIGALVSFEVKDQNNDLVASFTGIVTAGQTIDIGSTGLKVRFTAGTLANNKQAATNITQTPTNVSATALFNAAWASAPRFESFQRVSAGSFKINGASIAVNANDSIDSVISRINASSAGVTASVSGDRITLASNSNSEDSIVLSNDTSGFLAATKLSGASATRGNIRDDQQVLSKTTQFGSVATGAFTINGVSVSLNKDSDTLASLVSRINSAGAGVTAAYDSVLDKLVLTGTTNTQDLITVGNDGTGFLSAAHLETNNTVRGHLHGDTVALRNLEGFQSVANGSFTIDGETISVDVASDTMQSLIQKINDSSARVAASYDSIQDRIVLQATYNSEDNVAIGSDTSGFLAAAHLDAANTVKGNIRDDQQVLSKTSQFGDVTSGSFTVNGKTVTIDVTQDTVTSLLNKLNSADAGVTASFDSSTNRIQMVGDSDSEDLITLSDDTTGFLTAAHLSTTNTVRGNVRDDEQVLSKTSQFGSVADGTFTINGKTITVDADQDTLQTLIDKINSADAGTTATFNASTNKIEIAGAVASEDLISVDNDATGFLAVANLVSSNTLRGNLADDQQVFSKTSQFAAVTTGSFTINGISISVNRDQDTLQTLIDRINGADAGVTAGYDIDSDRLFLTPDVAGATLAVENDISGFLAAANVAPGVVGLHVNADGRFNATGLDAPLLDPGLTVQAGSFTVNGVAIDVAEDDSINTVVNKITASSAGVDASYDDVTQTVQLTSRLGVAEAVALGTDTSGFLAAVKLDETAVTTLGTGSASAFASKLSSMTEYSGVQAGTITVNGHEITVDPAATTIAGLISALNSIEDVSAALDETTGDLNISSRRQGVALSVSDTSGVLAELGIATGVFRNAPRVEKVVRTQTGTESISNATDVAANVSAATDKLNKALSQFLRLRNTVPGSRSETLEVIGRALAALGDIGTGMTLTAEGSELKILVDRGRLVSGLTGQTADETEIGTSLDRFNSHIEGLVQPTAAQTQPRNLVREQLRDILKSQASADGLSNTSPSTKSSFLPRPPDLSLFNNAALQNAEKTRDWLG